MKKLIFIIILLISSFSYYGGVDDKENKVTELENIVEGQNTVIEKTKKNKTMRFLKQLRKMKM